MFCTRCCTSSEPVTTESHITQIGDEPIFVSPEAESWRAAEDTGQQQLEPARVSESGEPSFVFPQSAQGNYGGQTLQQVFEHLRQSISIRDRTWLGVKYSSCADAVEMVDFLSKQAFCDGSRAKAVSICQELQKQDAITHVWGKKLKFRDTTMFFRFGKQQDDLADGYDLVVIGAGSAGISATSLAGFIGAKVVMLEAHRVGGDCTWSGCVPSKSLIKASHVAHDAKKAQDQFGCQVTNPCADMKKVKRYVWDKIHTVAKHDLQMLEQKNVPVRFGKASFVDKNTLILISRDGARQKIRSRSFILCLGAVPAPAPIKGLDAVKYHTYETIFDVDTLPKHMCVVGGGVIGCEMAQSFARLGAKVTLVASRLLVKEPEKVDQLLAEQFLEEGITLLRGRASEVRPVGSDGKLLKLVVQNKSGDVEVETDLLFVATGRRPNTSDGINLEAAGVELDDKTKLIKVDNALKTTAPHIYAAGDCCTLQQFTHYASIMGIWAARNLLLPGSKTPTHVVPRATFTFPEIASVGMTEAEARAQGFEIVSQPASHNERAVCEADKRGFIDVYLDKNGHIKGACIMNSRAGELLSEILIAMEKKFPFSDLGITGVVHPYPSYSWAVSMLATDVASRQMKQGITGALIRWAVSST